MSVFDPRIEKHLISDQGELVIDEVRKHWAAVVAAVLELFGGIVVLLLAFAVPQAWWLPALIGLAIILNALWRIVERRTDVFVITNMRVFRVHGILSRSIATMPLSRILDISVYKPLVGRFLGYGHFVFESAAQEQGLREIRYVGDPDARGLTIQRVIQQAGLRGFAGAQAMGMVPQARPVATEPVPAQPPVPPERGELSSGPNGWEWLADAQRREEQRLAELRGEPPAGTEPPFDPDRTNTAPIDLPR